MRDRGLNPQGEPGVIEDLGRNWGLDRKRNLV